MPSLEDLPAEILLKIARNLASDISNARFGEYKADRNGHRNRSKNFKQPYYLNPNSDLRHLALTSRKLRPIAQDILYSHPKTHMERFAFRNSPPQYFYLLRTILERPELAGKVRDLDLIVHNQIGGRYFTWIDHRKDLRHFPEVGTQEQDSTWRCVEAIETSERQLEKVKMGLGSRDARYEYYTRRIEGVEKGSKSTIADVLLTLLPKLEHLTIRTWARSSDGWDMNEEDKEDAPYTVDCLDPQFLFGVAGNCGLSPLAITTSIKSITSDTVLPWCVISLPTLRTLEYEHKCTTLSEVTRADSLYTPNGVSCSNITRLKISAEAWHFDLNYGRDDLRSYLAFILPQFTAINDLEICILARGFDEYWYHADDYNVLYTGVVNHFRYKNLSSVRNFILKNYDTEMRRELLDTLSMFPNLEQIVVEEDAIIDPNKHITEFPSSIQCIEIINATECSRGLDVSLLYARHHQYPALKRVILPFFPIAEQPSDEQFGSDAESNWSGWTPSGSESE